MGETTAIYPNRIEDKAKLESILGLAEFGNQTTKFYVLDDLFAVGYQRIVYGDHGPYVEFSQENIKCRLKAVYGEEELPPEKGAKYYYIWMFPTFDYNLKVYWQIKPVTKLKNAPTRADGKRSCFNREEGYADYRRGFYYVNPYDLDVIL